MAYKFAKLFFYNKNIKVKKIKINNNYNYNNNYKCGYFPLTL